ncbi:hypothetical protein [Halobacillus seohaensis]|uniref:Uncharacterized protein n=1 Tax=Halobacillus seohaensis TaxID=447421 RepID=A0ABW2ESE7_9BACI
MSGEIKIKDTFFEIIKSYYPSARICNPRRGNNPNRKEILVGNRAKRWMKIDDNSKVMHVSMDHYRGAITDVDVEAIHMDKEGGNKYKLNYLSDGNYDAVHFSFWKSVPYDFYNERFLLFLEKQFNAYMRL